MKRRWIALSLVILVAGAVVLITREKHESPPGASRSASHSERDAAVGSASKALPGASVEVSPASSAADEEKLPRVPSAATAIVEPRATAALTAAMPVAGLDLTAELDQVQLALRDFRTVHGENPVGTNAEITRALMGDNLKQIKLPVPVGSQVNAASELCDRWGTPYFFHQVSKTEMEVRSAGPDRTMWTNDDRQM